MPIQKELCIPIDMQGLCSAMAYQGLERKGGHVLAGLAEGEGALQGRPVRLCLGRAAKRPCCPPEEGQDHLPERA